MKCLFNGVELPALPEWDVQAYPYATITLNKTFGLYYLKCFSEAVYYESDGVVYFGGTDENQVSLITSGYAIGMDEWGEFQEYESSSIRLVDTDTVALIWTNFNAEYNGVMYMQASDPVPILAPTIEPLSMWMGWKAGNWVARQRGKRVEQPSTGVYDDTMPIEWTMLDVANNLKIPVQTWQIYSYNGHEFGAPAIDVDSDCKYHIIHKYDYGYYYTCTNQPFMYTEDNNKYAEIKESLKRIVYICKGDNIGFLHNDDLMDSGLRLLWDNIIWTNTDISDADGTVRMAATEPVYVREQVTQELVRVSNYIPTFETLEKSAVSVSYEGDEGVIPCLYADNETPGIAMAMFMDMTTYAIIYMVAIEREDNELVPAKPGLYFMVDEVIPDDVKFKFYIPEEMGEVLP